MNLHAASDWVLLHTVTGSRVAGLLASKPRPTGAGRVRISGPSPIRLLVTGGGMAVGYGVTDWGDAVGAALGRGLATWSGRGIVVDQTPLLETDPDEVDLVIEALDGSGYDLVVWSPSFAEDQAVPAPESWRPGAKAAARALGKSGCSCRGHIVIGVPELAGDGRDERVASSNIARANERLAAMAAAAPRTTFVGASPLGPLDGSGLRLGREYYERVASAMLPVASRMLEGASAVSA